jgi:hypothetical protein
LEKIAAAALDDDDAEPVATYPEHSRAATVEGMLQRPPLLPLLPTSSWNKGRASAAGKAA